MIKLLIKKIKSYGISFEAFLFAFYLFITPIQQILKIGGATYSKLISVGLILLIIVPTLIRKKSFDIDLDMLKKSLPYLGWTFISIIWATYATKSIIEYVACFSYILFFLVIISHNWNNKEKKFFMNILLISSIFYGILLILFANIMSRASFKLGSEMETDENLLSISIAIGAVVATHFYLFSKSYKKSLFYIILILLILVSIICTGSRGGLFTALVGIIYLLFAYKNYVIGLKKIKNLSIIVIITLLLVIFGGIINNSNVIDRFNGHNFNLSKRDIIWNNYISIMNSKPYAYIIGVGYANSRIEYSQTMGTLKDIPTHNDILCLVVETGFVGLISFAFIVYSTWKRSKYIYKDFLGRAFLLVVIIGALDINIIDRYVFWNSMILACIGIGVKAYKKKNLTVVD